MFRHISSFLIRGLYYKHVTIVNDDSGFVSKWSFKLNDDPRVVIYDHHRFIIQATGRIILRHNSSFIRHISSFPVTFCHFLSHFVITLSLLVIPYHSLSFFVTFHHYFVTFRHFSSFGSACCCCCCCSTTLQEWTGINRKQSTRWQHLSQLKASAFFSLRKNFSCYETEQLILGTGTAIWWVRASLVFPSQTQQQRLGWGWGWENLWGAPLYERLLALTINIRLGRKGLPGTKTVAYNKNL
jgi:hypothetical protein